MSKRLILLLALAFVVAVTGAAYAEVQNVKVSGDITIMGVARDNFDLAKTSKYGTKVTSNFEDKDRDFLSITRVRVDADLTDNVMATVRLLNERDWDGDNRGIDTGTANRNIGLNNAQSAEGNEIDLDLAYVTLKEFLYSPLSLTIGRQEMHFGNELIVGDPDTNIYSAITQLAEGDLSARKSFDALRATLDYNPLVVDVIYAKVQEGGANLNDDVTLSGINAAYALNSNTNIEGFLFNKVRGSDSAVVYNLDAASATTLATTTYQPVKARSDIVNTIGVRVTDKTVKNLSLDGTLAYQFGRYNPLFDSNARYSAEDPSRHAHTSNRSAWAAQVMAGYDLKEIDMLSKYAPMLSASYTYLSGANRDEDSTKESYKGWDPMFENQTVGHIMNAIFANTNMHRGSLSAKAKLTDDITANLDYVAAWFAKRYPKGLDRMAILSGVYGTTAATSGRIFVLSGENNWIGQEIDATLTYDYTEDVQFGLMGGIFLGSNGIRNFDTGATTKGDNARATELIGSMKVTF